MGRSFEGVSDVSARWLKASRALKIEDQVSGKRLAEMVYLLFISATAPVDLMT